MQVISTFGMGADVILTLHGTPMILHEEPSIKNIHLYGLVRGGSIALTLEQANDLVEQLKDVISKVESFEEDIVKYEQEHLENS